MIRKATLSENQKGNQVIQNLIKQSLPTYWYGNGLSYAVASIFARICITQGYPAVLLRPSEFIKVSKGKTILISQSGRNPGFQVDLIISQEGADLSWTETPCLAIKNVEKSAFWLSIDNSIEIIKSVSNFINIAYPKKKIKTYIKEGNAQNLFIVEQNAQPLKELLQSCSDKVKQLPFHVIDRDEIGHGMHYKIWDNPNKYRLYLLIDSEHSKAWDQIRFWLEGLNINYCIIPIHSYSTMPAKLIESSLIILKSVKAWLEMTNIQYWKKPIPKHLDQLR